MRITITSLIVLGALACDAPRSSTEPASPVDASSVDAALPDAGPDSAVDAAPERDMAAAESDAAPPAPDARVLPERCLDGPPTDPWPLVPGEVVEAELCRQGEAWFEVEVPAGFELSVELRFRHARGDLELALYSARSTEPLVRSVTATDVERVTASADAAATFRVRVYGYRGAAGPFALEARLFDGADARPTVAEGRVRYEDRPFGPSAFLPETELRPARGVVVQAVRALDGAVVGEAVTDEAGRYRLEWPAQPLPHRIVAVSELRLDGFVVQTRAVRDGLRYGVEAEAPAAGDEGEVDLDATEYAAAAALNIVDVAGDALRLVLPFIGAERPPLDYRWSPGHAHGCGSCYGDDTVSLGGGLEDTDEFDDAIILHELGHWFVEHFSADDSPGGAHRDRRVSPRLAYGEGVAYFFAALVLDDPRLLDTYIDSVRAWDLEAMTVDGERLPELFGTETGTPRGAQREELVAGLMWDAHDEGDDEPFDTLALGVEGSLRVLVDVFGAGAWRDVGAGGIDVADWLHALTCGEAPAPVQSLADAFDYPFEAEGARCEKGRLPPPFALARRGGVLWADGEGTYALVLRRGRARDALRRAEIVCALPCPLAKIADDELVVLSAPGAPWAGASWVGKRASARLLGGRRLGSLRVYPSR